MMHTRLFLLSISAAASLGAVGTAAHAQDESGKNPDVSTSPIIGKLENCTAITDNDQRLACFDREVGALVGASNEGDVKVVEAQDITQARRRLFGFSLPKVGLFGDSDEKEVSILQSTITKVRQVSAKEWHFWIEEGDAKWRMKSTSVRFRAPEVGDTVEFKPASMNTYWIRVNGRKGVRGNRIG